MKRSFTLLAAALFVSIGVFAQSNTMYMIEEMTNASCGPCASQNPAFDELLDANSDKVVVLKYQVWYPGYDPMYLDNENAAIIRNNYYDNNGVPTAYGNGVKWANDCGAWSGAPLCLSSSEIDAAYDVISPLTMDISGYVTNGTLYVSGTITADMALTGNIRLRIALAEKSIQKSDAPGGSNSEQVYHHVLKKFVGGPVGIGLGNLDLGEVYIIEESLDLSDLNIYDYDELEVVGFVQNHVTREVYQAAKDEEVELISGVSDSESELNAAISVGPNPVSDMLNVSITMDNTEDVHLEMMNSLGQRLHTEMINRAITQVDVSNFESGIYYLIFSTGDTHISRKVSVIR